MKGFDSITTPIATPAARMMLVLFKRRCRALLIATEQKQRARGKPFDCGVNGGVTAAVRANHGVINVDPKGGHAVASVRENMLVMP